MKMINVRFTAHAGGGHRASGSARVASGSERTVLRRDLAEALGLTRYPDPTLTMVSPEGARVSCFELPIILTVQGRSVVIVAAIPDLHDTPRNLIGDDFLRAAKVRLDCSTGRLTFGIPPQPKRREFQVGGGLWTIRMQKTSARRESTSISCRTRR